MRLAVLDVGSNTIHLAVADLHGTRRGSHKPGCPLHNRDGRSTALVLLGDRDSSRADDKFTFVGGGNELPLWGLVPEGTVRGGPVAARDPPAVQRWRSAPGFRRRYYLASSTGGIETVRTWMSKASRSPFSWFPDPHPQSQLALSGEWSGRAARSLRAVDSFRYAAISAEPSPARLRRQSQPALVATQRGAYGSRSGLTTGSYA